MTKSGILSVLGLAAVCVASIGLHNRVGRPVVVTPTVRALRPAAPAWHTLAGSAALGVLGGPYLWGYRAGVERPIASVTKTMTADIVLTHPHRYPWKRTIAITPAEVLNDRRGLLKADSEVPLRSGQHVTVGDLLEALMLPSADDSAWVLADNYPGGSSAFIAAMNQRARELGMQHTHYVDPDGVNHRGYSTASDLMKLMTADMKIPAFRQLVRTKTADTAFGQITNLNQLLWTYRGAIGIKTGWTPWAGSCLAFAATRRIGGRMMTLQGVVLGEPSFGPMFQDVTQLLNTGFQSLRYQVLLPKGGVVAEAEVAGGFLAGSDREKFVVSRPLGAFATAPRAHLALRWMPLRASGYRAGEVVGYAGYREAGWQTAWVPVVATRTISVSWLNRI